MSYANANMDRMLGDLIRYGRIESVDFETMTAAVDFDGLLVTGLEWAKSRAGDDRSGNAPSEGEQVCVLSPSGDIAQGVIAFSISQEKFPNPNKNANPKTIYVDGTYIEYDKQSHTLTVDASQAGGEVIVKCSHVQIDAPETICTGNLSVGGALAVKGKSTMSGDVSFTGASVTHNGKNIGGSHTHNKVKSGGDNSGEVN
ncbi:phage baseplate assembly protein V [Acinetobacter bereziniae]|uniref:phage baseplate assembly protein V n=1 Tax=Acinetobacter bereziniae TaxID=106648 RepID=UPI00124FD4AC|nr:phage baseplate assembly protein V [Acinetobacter bereziniae]